MTIDEKSRHELHEAACDKLGQGPGETLMEMLPPVGWGDVATKHDLDAQTLLTKRDLEIVETRLRGEIEGVETRLRGEIEGVETRLRGEIHRQVNRLLFWLVPILIMAVAAARVA